MRFHHFTAVSLLLTSVAGASAVATEYTPLPYTTLPVDATQQQALQIRLDKLQQLLQQAGDYQRYILLDTAARTAMQLRQYDKARNYATELLTLAEQYPLDWNYSSALHQSRIILGKLALHNDDIAAAERYLLAAASVPLSDTLNQKQPDLELAQALLKKGRTDSVIDYLKQIRSLWPAGTDRLNFWIKQIRNGKSVKLKAPAN